MNRRVFLPLFLALALSALAPPPVAGAPPQVPDEEAHRQIGKEATVCGRIADTSFMEGLRGRPTFLNMGGSYPNHTFTIVIWDDARGKFDSPPHLLFAGAEVCVTGRVETYKGKPQIIVRNPSQIVVTEAPPFADQRFSREERIVLKAVLAGLGFECDVSSPEWDAEARAALEAFERSVGLEATGDGRSETLRALAEAVTRLDDAEKTKVLRLLLLNLAQREAL